MLVIVSAILPTLTFDSGSVLLGVIVCLSLLGRKGVRACDLLFLLVGLSGAQVDETC